MQTYKLFRNADWTTYAIYPGEGSGVVFCFPGLREAAWHSYDTMVKRYGLHYVRDIEIDIAAEKPKPALDAEYPFTVFMGSDGDRMLRYYDGLNIMICSGGTIQATHIPDHWQIVEQFRFENGVKVVKP